LFLSKAALIAAGASATFSVLAVSIAWMATSASASPVSRL
jgi:hypothetical protein